MLGAPSALVRPLPASKAKHPTKPPLHPPRPTSPANTYPAPPYLCRLLLPRLICTSCLGQPGLLPSLYNLPFRTLLLRAFCSTEPNTSPIWLSDIPNLFFNIQLKSYFLCSLPQSRVTCPLVLILTALPVYNPPGTIKTMLLHYTPNPQILNYFSMYLCVTHHKNSPNFYLCFV